MTSVPEYARGYAGRPGRIGRLAAETDFGWPRERRAPKGAPNVIVVLLDDMGYSDIAPFGGEIDTPNLSRLAGEGVALTNYHTTPLCSPSRAAFLTGCNPHRVGYSMVANFDLGLPGFEAELPDDVLTLPEILRESGYATFAVGKWHLCRDAAMHDAADKSHWPLQRGFDRYYGTLESANTFFHPNRITSDNSAVRIEDYPDDYYLTDDLTDNAIDMIRALRSSDSEKPFFLWFAHHAMHGPLGAKPADLAKYAGRYAEGWDRVRESRLARQIAAGIFPEGTPLPPRENSAAFGVPAWADLTSEQRERFGRYMEVYAAMVDNVDQNLGRLLGVLDELGERENTIVIFTSDNGGTGEGGPEGTRSYFSSFIGVANVQPRDLPAGWTDDSDLDLALIGGPRSMVHYPRGWGMASNTPFRFYKSQTFAGGVRVPWILSWPNAPTALTGLRHQYQYVTDMTPTILELTGVPRPATRQGRPALEPDGVSFLSVLADPAAPTTHPEQYTECGGQRGLWRDGWKIVSLHRRDTPFDDSEFELYHVATDPNELHNRAAEQPELVAELAALWEGEAWHNTVFPLVERPIPKRRRPADDRFGEPVTLFPGTPKLERHRAHRLIDLRDFEVEIEFDYGPGDEGVLVAHGDQGGGYQLRVEAGELVLAYNAYGLMHHRRTPMPDRAQSVTLRATALPDVRWRLELEVDGTPAGEPLEVVMLIGFAPWSGIDVGVNRQGPVDWELYERHRTFPWTGTLHRVHYRPRDHAPYDASWIEQAQRSAALVLE